MEKEDVKNIKPGDTVLVEARVSMVSETTMLVSHGCITHPLPFSEIYPVPTHPKYDPCREFREGDKVRVRKIHGNLPQCRYNGMVKIKEGDCCIIHEKEHRNCYWVTTPSGDNWCFDIAYFELVTPVEELEPYCVVDNKNSKSVEVRRRNPVRVVASFYWGGEVPAYTQEEARKAAEAECARLNEEHRKENA